MTAAATAPAPGFRTGAAKSRLRSPVVIVAFGVLLLVGLGIAVLAVSLSTGETKPTCLPGRICGGPPPTSGRLSLHGVYKSSALGYQFEYPDNILSLASKDANSAALSVEGDRGSMVLLVEGRRGTDYKGLYKDRLDALRSNSAVLDLAADPSESGNGIHNANVGYEYGTGGFYAGRTNDANGVGRALSVAIMAATDGKISIVVTVLGTHEEGDDALRRTIFSTADTIVNTVRWPGGNVGAAARGPLSGEQPGSGVVSETDKPLGRTDPSKKIDFSVVLAMPRERAFKRFVSDVQNSRSPRYRHFATPAAIGARYGLPLRAIARVRRTLESHGLRVTESYPQRTALRARGTVRDVSRFFRVRLRDYANSSGVRYHQPAARPVIPRSLGGAVISVTGLDTQPMLFPAAVPANGMKPKDVAAAYDVKKLWDQGLHGEGQTVAIVSFDTFTDESVRAFDAATGIQGPPVEHVLVRGGNQLGNGTVEVNLDIDNVRTMAPKAKILNYEGPNTLAAASEIYRRIVADRRADIVSNSWGKCQTQEPREIANADERELATAAAAGVSMFVASGDAGAYDCEHNDPTDHSFTVDWPSSSPSVISVGGTKLSVRQDGSYDEEVGWEDVLSGGAGGGGLSGFHARPSWQKGPGVSNRYSNGKRQVPDVAAAADCDSAFFIVYFDADGQRHEGPEGCGTSAAAPFWAGATVLVRQLAERQHVGKNGFGRLGYLNPVLYALAQSERKFPPFHEVTRGGNRFYRATPGWDYSTGLGTPDVNNLARAIVAYLKAHPQH